MKRQYVLATAVALVLSAGGVNRGLADASSQPATAPTAAPVVENGATMPGNGFNRSYQGGMRSYQSPNIYSTGYYIPNNTTMENPADVLQRASCVLQLDGDFDQMNGYGPRIDLTTVASLANSTALVDPAAKLILGLTPDQTQQRLIVNAYPTGIKFLRLEVVIRKGDGAIKESGANDLLAAVIERIKSAISLSIDTTRTQMGVHHNEVSKQIEQTQKQLADIHAKTRQYRDATNGLANAYNDPRAIISNIEMQKRTAESELARYTARLKAIQPEAPATTLVSQWEQIVALQQKQLNTLKADVAAGKGNASDITDQETKLAEAKVQLATVKQQQNVPANDVRRVYGNEVPSLQSSIAEEQERIKGFDDQLAKLKDPKFLELADQYPQFQQEEQRLNNTMSVLNSRLQQLEQGFNSSGSMTITVLNGEPATK